VTLTVQIGASAAAGASEGIVARTTALDDAPVIRTAPATSLRALDTGVCIAQDAR
jgi:hypothetical protein